MKKTLWVWIMIFCFVLVYTALFAGCRSESPVPGTAADRTGSGSSIKSELPVMGKNLKYDPNIPVNGGKDIVIEFWTASNADLCKKYANEYSKIHTNVKIEVTEKPWGDYWKKLLVALRCGQGPDVMWMHNAFTSSIIRYLEPYPEEILPLELLRKDFRQVDQHIINGKLYYIDMGIMTGALIYNKKMWAEAGLTERDMPKTWDQLRKVCKKLTKVNYKGEIVIAGFNYNTVFRMLAITMAVQKGIFLFKKDGKTAAINNKEMIEIIKYIKDMYEVDRIGNIIMPTAHEAFGQGRAAIIYDWTWVPGYIKQTFPDTAENMGLFPVPTFDGKIPPAFDRNNGESSLVVNSGSKDDSKKVAMDFVKYTLANDDFLIEFDINNGVFPSKLSLDNNPRITGNSTLITLSPMIDRTIWPGPIPEIYEQDVDKYLEQDFLTKNIQAEEAVRRTQEMLDKDLPSTGFVSVERTYKYADEFIN